MTVLVTGSAGRIGRQVVQRLLADGASVRGFDRAPSAIDHPHYHEIIGTFDQREAAKEAVADVTSILHLGAAISWQAADDDLLFRANVDGTRILLDAARGLKLQRFVFASSGEVYPENAPAYQPIDEDHPLQPRSTYGLTKQIGEELVRFFERTTATPCVILRFSHTQDAAELLDPTSAFSGPRFFLHPKIQQQTRLGNGAAVAALRAVDDGREALVLSRNENGRPYRMHITETRDMVEGILLAVRHPDAPGRAYNLGSTEPADFADLLPSLAQATGLPVRVVDLPGQGAFYHTSNARIRALGFTPVWTLDRMVATAAAIRNAAKPAD